MLTLEDVKNSLDNFKVDKPYDEQKERILSLDQKQVITLDFDISLIYKIMKMDKERFVPLWANFIWNNVVGGDALENRCLLDADSFTHISKNSKGYALSHMRNDELFLGNFNFFGSAGMYYAITDGGVIFDASKKIWLGSPQGLSLAASAGESVYNITKLMVFGEYRKRNPIDETLLKASRLIYQQKPEAN